MNVGRRFIASWKQTNITSFLNDDGQQIVPLTDLRKFYRVFKEFSKKLRCEQAWVFAGNLDLLLTLWNESVAALDQYDNQEHFHPERGRNDLPHPQETSKIFVGQRTQLHILSVHWNHLFDWPGMILSISTVKSVHYELKVRSLAMARQRQAQVEAEWICFSFIKTEYVRVKSRFAMIPNSLGHLSNRFGMPRIWFDDNWGARIAGGE